MLLRILISFLVLVGIQQAQAQYSNSTTPFIAAAVSGVNAEWSSNNAQGLLQNKGLKSSKKLLRHSSHGDYQRFGVTLNYRMHNSYEPVDNSSDLHEYLEESAMSLNLRLYNIRNWALRIGAGYRDVDYTISESGIGIDYDGFRRDYTLMLGLEKHFLIGDLLDVYPGVVVPIAYIGDDEIGKLDNNLVTNIENDNFVASFGVLLGANVRLFRVLRIGAEFTGTYDEFKQKIIDNIPAETSNIKLKNLHYYTDITVGLTF